MAKRRRVEGEVSVFLGADSSLDGELKFSGQARLDGRFTGRIHGTGTLMVGPAAHLKADIEADTVIISGEVIGAVVAAERIELKAPGKLRGDINAPLVVMDEGVQFEGHCSMAGGEHPERVTKITLLASAEK